MISPSLNSLSQNLSPLWALGDFEVGLLGFDREFGDQALTSSVTVAIHQKNLFESNMSIGYIG